MLKMFFFGMSHDVPVFLVRIFTSDYNFELE